MKEEQKKKLKQLLIDYFGENAVLEDQWDSLVADVEEILD